MYNINANVHGHLPIVSKTEVIRQGGEPPSARTGRFDIIYNENERKCECTLYVCPLFTSLLCPLPLSHLCLLKSWFASLVTSLVLCSPVGCGCDSLDKNTVGASVAIQCRRK